MATRLRVHPVRRGPNGAEKYCPLCNRYRLLREFNVARTGERAGEVLPRCKDCRNRPRVRHLEATGYIGILSVWWIFDEIAQRVGQKKGAALIDMSPNGLSNLLNKKTRRVQRRMVARAINTLRVLRADNVWSPPPTGRRSQYTERCRGCGGELTNYTNDCKACHDRKRYFTNKEKEHNLKLTVPQVLAMFGVCQKLGLKHTREFELLSRDEYGNVIAELTTDRGTARYKLPAEGGYDTLIAPPALSSGDEDAADPS